MALQGTARRAILPPTCLWTHQVSKSPECRDPALPRRAHSQGLRCLFQVHPSTVACTLLHQPSPASPLNWYPVLGQWEQNHHLLACNTPLQHPSPFKGGFSGAISQRDKLRPTDRLIAKDHRLWAEEEFVSNIDSSFRGRMSFPQRFFRASTPIDKSLRGKYISDRFWKRQQCGTIGFGK